MTYVYSSLEAGAELSGPPLEGDVVFEDPHRHHFAVLQRDIDELDGAEGARSRLGDISPRWDRMQGAILGVWVRARLPVFASLAAASTIHLYFLSLTKPRLVGLDP